MDIFAKAIAIALIALFSLILIGVLLVIVLYVFNVVYNSISDIVDTIKYSISQKKRKESIKD